MTPPFVGEAIAQVDEALSEINLLYLLIPSRYSK
jgi:hypothetical protein